MNPYKAIEVGQRLRIVRPNQKYPPTQRVDIVIARGAFGSGEHETTLSCLEEIEKVNPKDMRVLDIGCGTGILAIAALKLGAEEAVCIDIAREAIETTVKNAALNGVDKRLHPVLGTLNQLHKFLQEPYHLILANIYPEVLKEIASQIKALSTNGTILIASGVPWEDNHEIVTLYKSLGFQLLNNRWLEQYTTFTMLYVG